MDRQPPDLYNLEAEASLLGAVLIGGRQVLQSPTVKAVQPSDFWDHKHRDVWSAILKVASAGLEVDELMTADELQKRGQLEDVGGMTHLVEMINACPSVMSGEHYASLVRSWSERREVRQAISVLGGAVYKDGTFDGVLGDTIDKLIAVRREAGTGWPTYTLAELLADETPVPEDIVAGLIPGRSATLLSGPGGDGKSYAMLDMAMCVSRGLPWLGLDTQLTPVLIVDLENRLIRVCERVQKAMRGHSLNNPPLIHVTFGLHSRLDSDESILEIAYLAERCNAGLVVLDSLVDFLGEVDENSNAEMGRVAERLRAVAEEVGGLIAIHHTPKGNAQTPRGATALRNGVDVNIIVSRDGDNLTLKQDKNRTGPEKKVVARMNWGDGLFNLSPICVAIGRTEIAQVADKDEEAILNVVDEGGGEWVWSNEIVQQTIEATGHARSTIHRKLEHLIADHVLEKEDRGKGKRYPVRRVTPQEDADD